MEKPIGKRLLEMLNGQIMTDITFIVQGTEIKGHRNIVSSYGGPLREILDTSKERVKIPEGVSANTFWEVLQYLYTDECKIDEDNVFELLQAAKIFHLDGLLDRCITELKPPAKGTERQTPTKLNEDTQKISRKTQTPTEVYEDVYRVEVRGCTTRYYADENWWDAVVLYLPLSTTIYQVKQMQLFAGGTKRCSPDMFSLEYCREVLTNDTTLGSFFRLDYDFPLQIHAFTLKIRKKNRAWEFPLIVRASEFQKSGVEIIKDSIYRNKGIDPSRVRDIDLHMKFPGDKVDILYV